MAASAPAGRRKRSASTSDVTTVAAPPQDHSNKLLPPPEPLAADATRSTQPLLEQQLRQMQAQHSTVPGGSRFDNQVMTAALAASAAQGDFQTAMVAMRVRTTAMRQSLKELTDCDDKRALAGAMHRVAELEQHLAHMQREFEQNLRQLKCRAWYGTQNDLPAQSMGAYSMVPLWH
jgi:hypothetical protein